MTIRQKEDLWTGVMTIAALVAVLILTFFQYSFADYPGNVPTPTPIQEVHATVVAGESGQFTELYVDGLRTFTGVNPVVTDAPTDLVLSAANNLEHIRVTTAAPGTTTITLPAASDGLSFSVENQNGCTLYIDPADVTDQIAILTDAAGDRILDSTAGDMVCITALDSSTWMVWRTVGAWTDGN